MAGAPGPSHPEHRGQEALWINFSFCIQPGGIQPGQQEIKMMERALNDFEHARSRMAGDFKAIIADSEELLKASASVSGAGFDAARKQFEEKLQRARVSLAEATKPMLDKAGKTAAVADDYVRGNPWTSMGVAMAAGALIALLVAKR